MSTSHEHGVTPGELSAALKCAVGVEHSVPRRRIPDPPGGFEIAIVGMLTHDPIAHSFAIIDSVTHKQILLDYDLPLDLAEQDYGKIIMVSGRTRLPQVPERLRVTAYYSSTTEFSAEEQEGGIRFIDPQVVQFVKTILADHAGSLPGHYLSRNLQSSTSVRL
ncbi:MAG: hypothetical protein ACP5OR_06895 [Candidatus Dormibacteria bacterium]